MKNFLRYTIEPIINEKNKQQAKFVIKPLEKGMGTTLGNALRRTLLFDIPGSSIFAIKINDATHEFQSIDGIKEDITQIVLNLKGLVIKIDEQAYTDEELSSLRIEKWPLMVIKATGKKIIHASDIECPIGFQIINKDLYICELTNDNSKLDLSLFATRGRGFVPFNINQEKINSLHIIATDSNFSPIVNVAYSVDEYKISKDEIGDILTIEIATNGSITPELAIALTAKILSEHLTQLMNIDKTVNEYRMMEEQKEVKQSQTLSMSIDELGLSVRSYNCLKRYGIQTVEQLINRTKSEVARIRNLGRKSLIEIEKKITEEGLSFKKESSKNVEESEVENY